MSEKIKVAIIGCGAIANSAHIPAYMKNEKGKNYAETKKEYPLLRDNQDFLPVFCNSAEALLNNVTILKEAEKAAIINLCKNLIEKYKE